jgi:hypothetical protein
MRAGLEHPAEGRGNFGAWTTQSFSQLRPVPQEAFSCHGDGCARAFLNT